MRIVKATDFTLVSPTFTGANQETPTATTGTPTCVVTNDAGTALTAPTVTSGATVGVYNAALTGAVHTANLDRLSIVWSGTAAGLLQTYTDQVDIVGRRYVTIPQMRSYNDLADTAKYPTSLLTDIRTEYEDLIERVVGTSFVRRYQKDYLYGGGQSLQLRRFRPRTILSLTVNGTAVSPTGFELTEWGTIVYPYNIFQPSVNGLRNVVVTYEYGHDIPPAPLVRALLKCIRAECLIPRSKTPSNMIRETTQEGTTIQFSTPDPANGRPTGIMALDPLLIEYSESLPGIA